MSIRGIIEAATARQGEWKPSFVFDITDGSDRTSDASDIIFVNNEREQWDDDPFFVEPSAVAEYLVAFQPEHVSLMEAVVEATEPWAPCSQCSAQTEPSETCGLPHSDEITSFACVVMPHRQALESLLAYRRERGLL